MSNEVKKTTTIQARIGAELKSDLLVIAKNEGVKISEILRKALLAYRSKSYQHSVSK